MNAARSEIRSPSAPARVASSAPVRDADALPAGLTLLLVLHVLFAGIIAFVYYLAAQMPH